MSRTQICNWKGDNIVAMKYTGQGRMKVSLGAPHTLLGGTVEAAAAAAAAGAAARRLMTTRVHGGTEARRHSSAADPLVAESSCSPDEIHGDGDQGADSPRVKPISDSADSAFEPTEDEMRQINEASVNDGKADVRLAIFYAVQEAGRQMFPAKHRINPLRKHILKLVKVDKIRELCGLAGIDGAARMTKKDLMNKLHEFLIGVERSNEEKQRWQKNRLEREVEARQATKLSSGIESHNENIKRIVFSEEEDAGGLGDEDVEAFNLDGETVVDGTKYRRDWSKYSNVLNTESIVELLLQVDARDVCVINVDEQDCSWTEKMIVCSCRTTNHVKRVAHAVLYLVSDSTQEVSPGKQPVIEGGEGDEWKIVDCGNIIVHLFTDDARDIYNVESLWGKPEWINSRHGSEVLEEEEDDDDDEM